MAEDIFDLELDQVVNINSYSTNSKVGLEDFNLIKVIGKGAYGKVFLVDYQSTLYAMKVLKKASLVVHNHKTERNILESLEHPYLVKLYHAFQTLDRLYLILTYAAGGELFTRLSEERMFSENVCRFYICELYLALDHLHSLGIIYRDLKPENVLLGANGHIMLTDFGLSKVAVNAKTVCGTIEFMAPEVLNSQQYNKSVDYWSLGVLMYDMLTGKPPFRGANYQKIMESILHKKPAYPKYITPQAKDLLGKLLRKMPAKRLGTETDSSVHFKKHEFFRKVDWGDVLLGQEPPYIPPLKHAEDTSNFAQEFTNCSLGSAQANAILGGDELIPSDSEPSKDPEHFVGFSFSRDCPLDHFQ